MRGWQPWEGLAAACWGSSEGLPYGPFQPQDSTILLNLTSSLLAILSAVENADWELEPFYFLGVRTGSPHRDHESSSRFLLLYRG